MNLRSQISRMIVPDGMDRAEWSIAGSDKLAGRILDFLHVRNEKTVFPDGSLTVRMLDVAVQALRKINGTGDWCAAFKEAAWALKEIENLKLGEKAEGTGLGPMGTGAIGGLPILPHDPLQCRVEGLEHDLALVVRALRQEMGELNADTILKRLGQKVCDKTVG